MDPWINSHISNLFTLLHLNNDSAPFFRTTRNNDITRRKGLSSDALLLSPIKRDFYYSFVNRLLHISSLYIEVAKYIRFD